MARSLFVSAALTGVFCAAFAVGIDYITDMLARGQVILLSFSSGFLGSIFARIVLGRGAAR